MSDQARYDVIGKDYNDTRRPDEKIVKLLDDCLDLQPGSRVIDIGAGTGNYTQAIAERGHFVTAVEPSAEMIAKGSQHPNIEWKQATAENLPFPDATFDAAYCTLSTQHFTDLEQSLAEIFRVLKPDGEFVVFTADPRRTASGFWMPHYFGPLYDSAEQVYPPSAQFMAKIKQLSQDDNIEIIPFPLPDDIQDGFFCSSWQNPERYFDPVFRQGISHFQLAEQADVQAMLSNLRQDIDSGEWARTYGEVRDLTTCDCGYYFVSATKQ